MTDHPGPPPPDDASFEGLRDAIYQKLLESVKLNDKPDKQFFPVDTAEKVLHQDRITRLFRFVAPEGRPGIDLVQAVKERRLHTFLAVLVYSQSSLKAWVRVIDVLIGAPSWPVQSSNGRNLAELPLEKEAADELFGADRVAVDLFCKNQVYFCAVVLRNKEEVICEDHRRVPYLEEVEIGSGAYGKVYRVLIAERHFIDEKNGMSNPEGKQLARKDYVLDLEDNSYDKERDVLREIVRNVKQNKNIVENMGSLQMLSTYSLFMPLADYDLETYMENGQRPTGWTEKAKILRCAAGIAGAIHYLHEELESETFQTLSCFHMDLKPKNILVFIDQGTGKEEWKLSDFNMSRVRATKPRDFVNLGRRWTSTAGETIDFNRLFRRRNPDVRDYTNSGSNIGTYRTGTYLAPETRIDKHVITAASDIWSLGCVIVVILSFLFDGVEAVKTFASMRAAQPIDAFFTVLGGRPPRYPNDMRVSEEVEKWLRELRSQTSQKNEGEGKIFKAIIAFLQDEVLLVDPLRRKNTSALSVKKKLIASYIYYERLNKGLPSTEDPRPPRTLRGSTFGTSLSSIFGKRTRSDSSRQSRDWEISFPDAVRSCEFGPNGQLLVCVSDSTLRAYSLEHVCRTNNSDDIIIFGDINLNGSNKRWTANVGVSSHFIVAATSNHRFEIYVYYIADSASHITKLDEVAHIMLDMPSIVKLAVSPDGRFVAFLLQESNKAHGSLYILTMEQLRLLNADRTSSVASSSSSSNSSFDFALHSRPMTTAAPAEDVRELKFSISNTIYAVIKPKRRFKAEEYVMTIRAWHMTNGFWKSHRPTEIEHDGRDDILQGLYTSFTPHNSKNVFTILSQEKRVLTRKSWEEGSSSITQSKAKGYRLLKALSSLDDETIYCFGTHESNDELRLLSFPPCPPGDKFTIQKGIELPGMVHQSKFAASLYYPSETEAARALVADIKDCTIRILDVMLQSRS